MNYLSGIALFLLSSSLFSFEINTLNPPSSIEGKWKIQKGDSTEYASPNLDDSGWESIQLPGTVASFLNKPVGYAWLRADLNINPSLKGKDIGLNLGRVPDIYEVFFNGVKLGGEGRFPSTPESSDFFYAWNLPAGVILPSPLIRYGQKNVIAIRLFYCNDGGIWDKIKAEEPTSLKRDLEFRKFFLNDLCLVIAFILWAVAVYHFLLYVSRPQEKENLYFSLFCVFISINTANFAIRDLPFDYIVKERIVFGLTPLFATPGAFFFRDYFNRKTKFHILFTRIAAGIQILVSLFIFSAPDIVVLRNRYDKAIVVILLSLIYIIITLVQALMEKNSKAKWIAVGFVLTVLMGLHDVAIVILGSRDTVFLLPYALPTLLFCIALVLSHDFVSARNQVEELNANLEVKVEDRTRELKKTLGEIRELKLQQDGDYFLTSLLLQPLSEIKVSSGPVSISSLVRQKKHFDFKKWESEIGGDICSAHGIQLRGRNYISFVNADAMGKSMQGAGGALVLGTVYKAVITRTQKSTTIQNKHPEQWLKECFLELQDVFVSFDGSMLVSAILGLVDEETGFLYFINAEHPRNILYRDGIASFIESEQLFRKIGIAGLDGKLFIRTHHMKQGDVIIIGSDGRDDILIGMESPDKRIINENDTLFLQCVEEGKGDLFRIESAVQEKGQLTDDFSLMRFSYKENFPPEDKQKTGLNNDEAEALNNLLEQKKFSELVTLFANFLNAGKKDLPILIQSTRKLIQQEAYTEAATLAQNFSEVFPENLDLIYLVSLSMKASMKLEVAADYGEKLFLREPENIKNLVNLADIYRMIGNQKRAYQMLDRAKQISPDHKNIASVEALMK